MKEIDMRLGGGRHLLQKKPSPVTVPPSATSSSSSTIFKSQWQSFELELKGCELLMTYFAYMLTPVHLFVYQRMIYTDGIAIVLTLIDLLCAALYCGYYHYSGNTSSSSSSSSSSKKNCSTSFQLLAEIFSLPAIHVVPIIACTGGLSPHLLVWLSAPRLLRVAHLSRQFLNFTGLAAKSRYPISATLARIILTCACTILYVSTMACLWFFISCSSGSSPAGLEQCLHSSKNTWISNDEVLSIHDPSSRYFRSVHFILQTLFTVGMGDIHPYSTTEIVFGFVVILSAMLFCGYVVSSITSVMSNTNIAAKMFRSEIGVVKSYLKLRRAASTVRDNLLAYHEFLFSRQLGLVAETIFTNLPPQLVFDIKNTCRSQLRTIPFFTLQSDCFVDFCIEKLTFRTYAPGEQLFERGVMTSEMMLLRTGKVDIISTTSSQAIFSLVAGDAVGWYQLLCDGVPINTVTAVVFTETACLSQCALTIVMNSYSVRMGNVHASWCRFTEQRTIFLPPIIADKALPGETTAKRGGGGGDGGTTAADGGLLITTTGESKSRSFEANNVSTESSSAGATAAGGPSFSSSSSSSSHITSRLLVQGYFPCGTFYREGLLATDEYHRIFEAKIYKAKTALENTAKTKRKVMSMMMATSGGGGAENEGMPVSGNGHSRVTCIFPNSRCRFAWDLFMAFGAFYYCVAVPLRLMVYYRCVNHTRDFRDHNHKECISKLDWSLFIDYLFDIANLVDFVLHSYCFAFYRVYGERTVIETDPIETWGNFKYTPRFWVSIVVNVPIDFFAVQFGYLLCLRVSKMVSVLTLLPRIRDAVAWLERERSTVVDADAVLVLHLGLFTVFVTVWITVGWSLLHYAGKHSTMVSSLYWCLTSMTTTGYGDIVPESNGQTYFNLLVSIVGPLVFTTIVAKFASLMKSVDVSTSNMEHQALVSTVFLREIRDLAATQPLQLKEKQWLQEEATIREQQRPEARRNRALDLQSGNTSGNGADGIDDRCFLSNIKSFVRQKLNVVVNTISRRDQRGGLYSSSSVDDGDTSCSSSAVGGGTASLYNTVNATRTRTAARGVAPREFGNEISYSSAMAAVHGGLIGSTSASAAAANAPSAAIFVPFDKRFDNIEEGAAEHFSYMSHPGGVDVVERRIWALGISSYAKNLLRVASVEDMVRSAGLFAPCEPHFLHNIYSVLVQQFFCKKNMIIKCCPPDGVYFIKSGQVTMRYHQHDSRSTTKHAGQCFAEQAILSPFTPQAMEALASTDCELWYLSRSAFRKVLQKHPRSMDYLKKMQIAMSVNAYGGGSVSGKTGAGAGAGAGTGTAGASSKAVNRWQKLKMSVHNAAQSNTLKTLVGSAKAAAVSGFGRTIESNSMEAGVIAASGKHGFVVAASLDLLSPTAANASSKMMHGHAVPKEGVSSAKSGIRRDLVGLEAIDALQLKKRLQRRHINRFNLPPGAGALRWWSALLSVALLYSIAVLPLRIAFAQGSPISWTFAIDYFFDGVFMLDSVLDAFFVGYYQDDELIMDRTQITAHFLKSSAAKWNLASLFPTDLLIFAGPIGTLGYSQTLALYRINRLLRTQELGGGANVILQSGSTRARKLSPLFKNAVKLAKLTAVIFIIAHLFGSIFFVLANQAHLRGDALNWADAQGLLPLCTLGSRGGHYELQLNDDYGGRSSMAVASTINSVAEATATAMDDVLNTYNSSIVGNIMNNNSSSSVNCHRVPSAATMASQAVYSMYWSVAVLTTVGFGDISPVSDSERLYNILYWIVGTLIFAMVIVHLQEIVSQLDVTSDIFKRREDELSGFVSREGAPRTFVLKTQRYMAKLWSRQRGADAATEITSFLPTRVYSDAVEELLADQLHSLFFLKNCRKNRAFTSAFASKLHMVHYLNGDFLFRTGESSDRLFFVVSGSVSLQKLEMDVCGQNSADKVVSLGRTAVTALRTLLPPRLRSTVLQALPGRGLAYHSEEEDDVVDTSANNSVLSGISSLGGVAGPCADGYSALPSVNEITYNNNNNNNSASRNPNFKHKISSGRRTSVGALPSIASRSPVSSTQEPLSSASRGGGRASTTTTTAGDTGRGRRGSSVSASGGGGAGGGKAKTVSYSTVREGCIGEMECFTRSPYSCCAKATTDVIAFEMEFSTFYALLDDHRLVSLFTKLLNKEHVKLARGSTCTTAVVSKLQANLKANKKMMAAFSDCNLATKTALLFLPDSFHAKIWRLTLAVLLTLQAIFIPYFLVFRNKSSESMFNFQLSLDVVAAVIFCADVYVNLNLLAVTIDGALIIEPSEFGPLYKKKHLMLDIISTFPLSILMVLVSLTMCHPLGSHSFSSSSDTVSVLLLVFAAVRLVSLVRLRRIVYFFSAYAQMIEMITRKKFTDASVRLGFTTLVVLYLTHIFACVFCAIGIAESTTGLGPSSGSDSSWIELSGLSVQNSAASRIYLQGYYWAFYTVSTVGYGSMSLATDSERVFAIFIMVAGSILSAALGAVLNSMIESDDRASSHSRRLFEAAMRFSASNHLDKGLEKRIQDYYNYVNGPLAHSNEVNDFNLLSRPLRSELVLKKSLAQLQRLSFLNRSQFDSSKRYGFIVSLSHLMELYIAVPGEVLVPEIDNTTTNSSHVGQQQQQRQHPSVFGGSAAGSSVETTSSSTDTDFSNKNNLTYSNHTTKGSSSGASGGKEAGKDLLILRRGSAYMLLANSSNGRKRYFKSGRVLRISGRNGVNHCNNNNNDNNYSRAAAAGGMVEQRNSVQSTGNESNTPSAGVGGARRSSIVSSFFQQAAVAVGRRSSVAGTARSAGVGEALNTDFITAADVTTAGTSAATAVVVDAAAVAATTINTTGTNELFDASTSRSSSVLSLKQPVSPLTSKLAMFDMNNQNPSEPLSYSSSLTVGSPAGNTLQAFNRFGARSTIKPHDLNAARMQQLQSLVEEHELRNKGLRMSLTALSVIIPTVNRTSVATNSTVKHLVTRITVCGEEEEDIEMSMKKQRPVAAAVAAATAAAAAAAMASRDSASAPSSPSNKWNSKRNSSGMGSGGVIAANDGTARQVTVNINSVVDVILPTAVENDFDPSSGSNRNAPGNVDSSVIPTSAATVAAAASPSTMLFRDEDFSVDIALEPGKAVVIDIQVLACHDQSKDLTYQLGTACFDLNKLLVDCANAEDSESEYDEYEDEDVDDVDEETSSTTTTADNLEEHLVESCTKPKPCAVPLSEPLSTATATPATPAPAATDRNKPLSASSCSSSSSSSSSSSKKEMTLVQKLLSLDEDDNVGSGEKGNTGDQQLLLKTTAINTKTVSVKAQGKSNNAPSSSNCSGGGGGGGGATANALNWNQQQPQQLQQQQQPSVTGRRSLRRSLGDLFAVGTSALSSVGAAAATAAAVVMSGGSVNKSVAAGRGGTASAAVFVDTAAMQQESDAVQGFHEEDKAAAVAASLLPGTSTGLESKKTQSHDLDNMLRLARRYPVQFDSGSESHDSEDANSLETEDEEMSEEKEDSGAAAATSISVGGAQARKRQNKRDTAAAAAVPTRRSLFAALVTRPDQGQGLSKDKEMMPLSGGLSIEITPTAPIISTGSDGTSIGKSKCSSPNKKSAMSADESPAGSTGNRTPKHSTSTTTPKTTPKAKKKKKKKKKNGSGTISPAEGIRKQKSAGVSQDDPPPSPSSPTSPHRRRPRQYNSSPIRSPGTNSVASTSPSIGKPSPHRSPHHHQHLHFSNIRLQSENTQSSLDAVSGKESGGNAKNNNTGSDTDTDGDEDCDEDEDEDEDEDKNEDVCSFGFCAGILDFSECEIGEIKFTVEIRGLEGGQHLYHVRDVLDALYEELKLESVNEKARSMLMVAGGAGAGGTPVENFPAAPAPLQMGHGPKFSGDAATADSSRTNDDHNFNNVNTHYDRNSRGAKAGPDVQLPQPPQQQYGIIAEGFCHLFKCDSVKISKLQEYYQRSLLSVGSRFDYSDEQQQEEEDASGDV